MNIKKTHHLFFVGYLAMSSLSVHSTQQVLGTPIKETTKKTLTILTLTVVSMLGENVKIAIKAKPDFTVRQLEVVLNANMNSNFNPKVHSIECNNLILYEKKMKLSEYGIEDNKELYIRNIAKPIFFKFNNFKLTEALRFSCHAPEWRLIKPGLTYYGICKNKKADKGKPCKAYRKEVLINREFVRELYVNIDTGRFTDKGEPNNTCICPMCRKFVQNVTNCSFYMCKYEITGLVVNDDEKQEMQELIKIPGTHGGKYIPGIHNQRYKLSRFTSKSGEGIANYLWLKITTSRLP